MDTTKQRERLHASLRDLEEKEERGLSKPDQYFRASQTAEKVGETGIARRLAVEGHRREAAVARAMAEDLSKTLVGLERRMRAFREIEGLENGAAREVAAGDIRGAQLLHEGANKERYILKYQ